MRYSFFLLSGFLFFFQHPLFAQDFRVQVGAFEEKMNASYFTERGIESYVETADRIDMYRYFVGTYPTYLEAEKVRQEMVSKGFPFASIVDVEAERLLSGGGCPYFRNGVPYMDDPEQQMTVRNIYFDFGLSNLSAESQAELNNVAEKLAQKSSIKLKVLGYTDGIGDPVSNVELAASRAREARNYLINKGIRADRMFLSVFGEADPILPNGEETADGKIIDLPENRKWNRRVVLVLVEPRQ